MLNYRSRFNKSIVLIGFMGVGKTTIGEVVARKLGREFVDVDAAIERAFEMSIPDIFSSFGEETFRNRERELTLSYCRTPKMVISLGGGALVDEEVRKTCFANGFVVYLDLSWDVWKQHRFQKINDSRPVLQRLTSQGMKELFDLRKATYALHHRKIELDHLSSEDAADLIVDTVRRKASDT
jgi:shikimate kinase